MTASANQFTRLAGPGIEARTVEHPAVFSVDEARRHQGDLSGTFTKSLFLRDKKGAMWLVVRPKHRVVGLRALAGRIGPKHLSFGNRSGCCAIWAWSPAP